MPTDKDLASRLLNAIEDLYLENMIMKMVLKEKGWHSLEKVLAEAKADPEATGRIAQQFAQVRAKIQQDTDLAEAIQEFLKVVPPSEKLN